MKKLLAVLLVLPCSTLAGEMDWSRCRAISDDAARLACYDALGPGPAAAPATGNAGEEDAAPEAGFGIRQKAAEQRPSHIVSRIPGAFRGWNAGSIITLENGQAWQIADGSSGVYRLENPQVRVERGLFGVYVLRIDGANRAPKVKRLQ